MHRISIISSISLMISLPSFMVYCAITTGSTFWGCMGLALLFLVIFALFLINVLKNNRLAKMKFTCNHKIVMNQTARRINSIILTDKFYLTELNIPFYVGRGKTEFSYLVYTKVEVNPSGFAEYYGLSALQRLHETGAVLIPKEAFVSVSDEPRKSNKVE